MIIKNFANKFNFQECDVSVDKLDYKCLLSGTLSDTTQIFTKDTSERNKTENDFLDR